MAKRKGTTVEETPAEVEPTPEPTRTFRSYLDADYGNAWHWEDFIQAWQDDPEGVREWFAPVDSGANWFHKELKIINRPERRR